MAVTAVAGAAACAAGVLGVPPAAAAPEQPSLRLITGGSAVALYHYRDDPGVDLNLGVHLAAERTPFEVRLRRRSYRDPIVAEQIIRQGGVTRTRAIPQKMLRDFAGLRGMLHITITDRTGRKVVDRYQDFCPNGEAGRIRPDAPAESPYPSGCPDNPFTLGAVWGIQRGWAANTYSWSPDRRTVRLRDGRYTARVEVAERYRNLFGIARGAKTVKVTVRPFPEDEHVKAPRPRPVARPAACTRRTPPTTSRCAR